jgi:hypothetical protein
MLAVNREGTMDIVIYVITYFGHLMNEQRAYSHLVSLRALTDTQQRLCVGVAWDEESGNAVPAQLKSLVLGRLQGLSHDPQVLQLASDGFKAFFERTAERILAADRDKVLLNYCCLCGAVARTPKARQCRSCGHDWHSNQATRT